MNSSKKRQVKIFPHTHELFAALAQEFLTYSLRASIQHIALSGGSTPKGLFQYIVASEFANTIKWENLHFWWGDERCVSYDDNQSNFGEAKRLLFDHVAIPKQNLHPVAVSLNQDLANFDDLATSYNNLILDLVPHDGHIPHFDWILLGVGEDGHTASLFPGQFNIDEQKLVVSVLKPTTNEQRISLSAKTISYANRITYLATGKSKSSVLAEIINQTGKFESYPAYQVCSVHSMTEFWVDSAAGKMCQQTAEEL